MLDIKFIRDNLDAVKAALTIKRVELDASEFQQLAEARKKAVTKAQGLQAEKKKASKQIGALIAQGKTPDEAKAEVMGSIDSDIKAAEQEAKQAEQALRDWLMNVPKIGRASCRERV